MASWFLVRDGKEEGPVSSAELKARVLAGTLLRDDLVRRDDMQTPVKASIIKGLFPDAHTKVRETAESIGETAETVKKVAENTGKVADAVNEVADATDKLRQAATSIGGIAGAISAFAGSIGDFLRPLGDINLLIFLLAGATTPVLVVVARRQTKKALMFKYGAAAVVTLAVAVIFGLWCGLAAIASNGDKGVLATNIKPIDRLQESVIPVKEVSPPVTLTKAPPETKQKDDLTLLQGRWYAVFDETAGKAASKDDLFTMNKTLDVKGKEFHLERTENGNRGWYEGSVQLRQKEAPKSFDFEGFGPAGAVVEIQGIYELSEDTFKVCYMLGISDPQLSRPATYSTSPGSSRFFVIFKRSPLPPPPVTSPKPKDDLTLLQGQWYATAEEVAGKEGAKGAIALMNKVLNVDGSNFRIERTVDGNRGTYEGTVRLRQANAPKLFDFEGKGPKGNKMEMHGIYEVSEDTFKVCYVFTPSGNKYTRPSEYSTSAGSSRVYITFKRSPLPK